MATILSNCRAFLGLLLNQVLGSSVCSGSVLIPGGLPTPSPPVGSFSLGAPVLLSFFFTSVLPSHTITFFSSWLFRNLSTHDPAFRGGATWPFPDLDPSAHFWPTARFFQRWPWVEIFLLPSRGRSGFFFPIAFPLAGYHPCVVFPTLGFLVVLELPVCLFFFFFFFFWTWHPFCPRWVPLFSAFLCPFRLVSSSRFFC